MRTSEECLEQAGLVLCKTSETWEVYNYRTHRAQAWIELALAIDKVGEQ